MNQRTTLTVREARAEILYEQLLLHPEVVEVVEDIARLPRLSGWSPRIVGAAIDDLVAEGLITESADGRLCVRAHSWDRGVA